jgi:hypothetical protein
MEEKLNQKGLGGLKGLQGKASEGAEKN